MPAQSEQSSKTLIYTFLLPFYWLEFDITDIASGTSTRSSAERSS